MGTPTTRSLRAKTGSFSNNYRGWNKSSHYCTKPHQIGYTTQICTTMASHNSTLPIFPLLKICRVGLYTELFYALIPTLFSCIWLINDAA